MILSLSQLGWFSLALILYWCLLRRSGWLNFNRLYLLLLIPVTLWLADWTKFLPDAPDFISEQLKNLLPNDAILANEVASISESGRAISPRAFNTAVGQINYGSTAAPKPAAPQRLFPILYWIISGLFLLRLAWSHLSVFRLIRRRVPLTDEDGFVKGFVLPASRNLAFTYGPCYFVSPNNLSDPDHQSILAHERAHAAGWHSLDLLLADILLCFCWYFPPVWWYRRWLRDNLEYLADRQAIQQVQDRQTYLKTLLRKAQLTDGSPAFAFSTHPLKSRMMMLITKPLSVFALSGRLALLSLLLLCFTIGCVNDLEDEATQFSPSTDQFEFYFSDIPTLSDLAIFQTALSEVGAELFISIEDDVVSYLEAKLGNQNDRIYVTEMLESPTPVQLTLDPVKGVCAFGPKTGSLPENLPPGPIGAFRNGEPYLLPSQPTSSVFNLDSESAYAYRFQVFEGPNAWEEAHNYATSQAPNTTISYDYNDYPTNLSILTPPDNVNHITVRFSDRESPSVRMMLQTQKPQLGYEDEDAAAMAALSLVKPHPTLGQKFEIRKLGPDCPRQNLDDILKYAYPGDQTNFYLNGKVVNKALFEIEYPNLDRMALVKSYLDEEPVVVYGVVN